MRPVVCIIDDDDILRMKVAAILEEQGFATLGTGNAHDAIPLISSSNPWAVFVDIIMPDKDGIELIREIRSRWPNQRIIAMSGGGRIGPELFLSIAEKLGVQACLKKPFTAEDIASAVRNA